MVDQELSALPSLREFRGKWLFCSQSRLEIDGHLTGPVAEALWAVALGWPQLLVFELTECRLSPNGGYGGGGGDMQTKPRSLLR